MFCGLFCFSITTTKEGQQVFRCWNCGLLYGAEDEPEEPSRLCAICEAALQPQRTDPVPYDAD